MIASEVAKISIRNHEGLRTMPYKDSLGFLTIGWGRCLDKVGISSECAEFMLDEDLEGAEMDARMVYGDTFDDLSVNRQAVFIEMAFQLGRKGLAGFIVALMASRQGEHARCAEEMLNSTWAKQTPRRAQELADVYRLG